MKRLCIASVVVALTVNTVGATVVNADAESKLRPWTVEWFSKHRHPRGTYWDKVAKCETNGNWSDGGNWGGGLGIATTTWRNYGGYAFAGHPSGATRKEQIEVANRIAVRGYVRRDGSFQYPAGYGGWGCIRANRYLFPHPNNLWYTWKHKGEK